jgi:hypothetical protein
LQTLVMTNPDFHNKFLAQVRLFAVWRYQSKMSRSVSASMLLPVRYCAVVKSSSPE